MTIGLRLSVERLKEAPAGFYHTEFSESVKQELSTRSISALVTIFEDIYIINNLLLPKYYSIFTFG